MRVSCLLLVLVSTLACSKKPAEPTTANPEPTPTGDTGTTNDRPGVTAAACEEQGGKVVGDIGDGAIHRPDYKCPDSGNAPIGSIIADPGGPVAIEGSVCCL